MKTRIASILLLTVAACATSVSDHALPDELQRVLAHHIKLMHNAGLAPAWASVQVRRVRELQGPSTPYFEVALSTGTDASIESGCVVMSATRRDFAIVQSTDTGSCPTDIVAAQVDGGADAVFAFARIGVHTVALDQSQRVLAAVPNLTRPSLSLGQSKPEAPAKKKSTAVTWKALVSQTRDTIKQSEESDAAAMEEQWTYLWGDFDFNNHTPVCAVTDYQHTPTYRQLNPHEPPNWNWYYSGCGPTAWLMLLGWLDRQADAGVPHWAPHWQLFLQGGVEGPFALDATATATTQGVGEYALMMRLHDTFGTWGSTNNGPGATEPWRMDRMKDYLNRVGIRDSVFAVDSDSWGSAHRSSFKEDAKKQICAGNAAIVGIGDLEHYALATAVGPNDLMYLNMGFSGSSNGWYSDSFFYVGYFEAKKFNTVPPGALVNAATNQCLDIRGNQSVSGTPTQQWGCGVAENQQWQLLPTGEVLGMDRQCLDRPGGTTSAGSRVQVWECNGSDAQSWQPSALRFLANGGLCMSSIPSLTHSSGSPVPVHCDGGSANWTNTPAGQLRGDLGSCLEAGKSGELTFGDCSAPQTPASQRWLVSPAGTLRSLRNDVPTPQCLEFIAYNRITHASPRVVLNNCTQTQNQQWRVQMRLTSNGGTCLAIQGASSAMGADATLQHCSDKPEQRWTLVPMH